MPRMKPLSCLQHAGRAGRVARIAWSIRARGSAGANRALGLNAERQRTVPTMQGVGPLLQENSGPRLLMLPRTDKRRQGWTMTNPALQERARGLTKLRGARC